MTLLEKYITDVYGKVTSYRVKHVTQQLCPHNVFKMPPVTTAQCNNFTCIECWSRLYTDQERK